MGEGERRRSVERVREVFEKLRGTLILDPAPLSENFPSDPCKKRCAEKEHLLEREREGARNDLKRWRLIEREIQGERDLKREH